MTPEEREMEILKIANIEMDCAHAMLTAIDRVIHGLADTLDEQAARRRQRMDDTLHVEREQTGHCYDPDLSEALDEQENETMAAKRG